MDRQGGGGKVGVLWKRVEKMGSFRDRERWDEAKLEGKRERGERMERQKML